MNSKKTIVDIFFQRAKKVPGITALQYKDKGRWTRYSWADCERSVLTLAQHLTDQNVKPGSCVAIISETRPEWILSDIAIMSIGGITVPIYPNNLDEDIEYILNNADVHAIIIEDSEQLDKWQRISERCKSVKSILVIDGPSLNSSHHNLPIFNWTEAIKNGHKLMEANRSAVPFYPNIKIDDVATIIYTSGTTGRPKGVVLLHEQVMSEVVDVFSLVSVDEQDTSLTFLPYSHILGRVEAWGCIYAGYSLAFAESIEKIRANLQEIRPTFMIAVPRIFEKIYVGLLSQVENNPTKKKIFDKALKVGVAVSERLQNQVALGIKLSLEYEMAKLLVFKKVLSALGGRLRFAISGGAPLNSDIAKFFHGMGLPILEGYGLTETTAAVFVNTPINYKFGSVGRAIGDVQIRFAEDSEILVKSKKVMPEYYKNPEATKDSFVDSFFKTGDIGHLDNDGYLFITDRKKDLIKTSGGKYVAPQKIEGLLKLSAYISQVLVHGDQKKYIIALVTLNRPLIEELAKKSGWVSQNFSELSQSPEVYRLIKDVVADVNTQLSSFESIKKFAILPADFSVETGELTASLKVKRKYCDQKFKKIIDELY